MALRRIPRLAAAFLAVAALLLASPVAAAPGSRGGVGGADLPWLSHLWGSFLNSLGAWAGLSTGELQSPGSLDHVAAANGGHIDPDGSPATSNTSSDQPTDDASGTRGPGAGPEL